MSVQWVSESDVKQAIADVRSDKTNTDWMLISYEGPKSQNLVLAGSGSGGISELASHLKPDVVGYGLVRRVDKIDDSETVKFGFILYIGDKVPIMQKARISVHTGGVKDFIGQFHVDILASSTDELTEEALVRKIQDASGSGTHVLDKSGARQSLNAGPAQGNRPRALSSNKDSSALTFSNEDAIKELRAGSGGVNWVLYGFEGGNSTSVVLLGKGSGGVPELVDNLKDDIVGYALVRMIERVDESDTVKFAFINWVGDNIPRMLRARLGTYSGAVKDFIGQYHVDINATSKNEVTETIVRDTVQKAAGTKLHVIDKPQASSASSSSGSVSAPVKKSQPAQGPVPVATQTQGVKLADEQELRAAIMDVRNDSTPTNWVLVTYESATSDTLVLLGKGSGGTQELMSNLTDTIVAYGLVREVEAFDLSSNVRFAYVNWVGENIPRMQRARLGTKSGAVKDLFTPYHVDINPTNLSEISPEIIATKIRVAMGTENLVRNK